MPEPHSFEVVVLNERDYQSLYQESFQKPKYPTSFKESMHRAEFDWLHRGFHYAESYTE